MEISHKQVNSKNRQVFAICPVENPWFSYPFRAQKANGRVELVTM